MICWFWAPHLSDCGNSGALCSAWNKFPAWSKPFQNVLFSWQLPTISSLFPFTVGIIFRKQHFVRQSSHSQPWNPWLLFTGQCRQVLGLLDLQITGRDDGKVLDNWRIFLWRGQPKAWGQLFDLIKKSLRQNTHHGQVKEGSVLALHALSAD